MNDERSKPPLAGRAMKAFAEFAIIVVGVLTALSLESGREYLGEREREREYIAQIESDSRDNLILLDTASALEQRHMDVAQKIMEAFQGVEPLDVDSMRAWLGRIDDGAWLISDPRLLDGTITALVETGDLTLLGDPELRREVLAYRGQLRDDMAWFRYFAESGSQAVEHLIRRIEIKRASNIAPRESRMVRGYLAVHDDPESLADMILIRRAYFIRIDVLEEVRQATEDLLRVVSR